MTARSLALREWDRSDAVELTEAEVRSLANSNYLDIRPDRTEPGSWRVSAKQFVGAVCYGGLQIRIRPKVGVHRLMGLLCETIGRVDWFDTDTAWAETDDLLATVAGSYCTVTERVLTRGVLQGYRSVEDSLFGVRGRIDMTAQLGRRAGITLPVEVVYDDYSTDIRENQLVLGAALQLLRLDLPGTLRQRLRRVTSLLIDVTPAPASRTPPDVEFTRLNDRYRPAVTLARLILRSCALESDGDRSTGGSGLLVDMNVVFEDVVSQGLQHAAYPSGMRCCTQVSTRLDPKHGYVVIPDLVWFAGHDACAVADVKYRNPVDRDLSGNVYQALAYATRHRLDCAHLIYAGAPPVQVLKVADTAINFHCVDLDQPPEDRHAQIKAIATAVANAVRRR